MKAQTGLLGRHGQQQAPRKSRRLEYIMLSVTISVAIALMVLLVTSHRMVHLGSQGSSLYFVRRLSLRHSLQRPAVDLGPDDRGAQHLEQTYVLTLRFCCAPVQMGPE